MIEAKVIEDSISVFGKRITTVQVRFHRFILPELLTHRVFSRNFSSSRAIPVSKLIEQVRKSPAMPVHWGKNQPGMQAREELSGADLDAAIQHWQMSANLAADMAEQLAAIGAHKQIVNRVIEPYLYVSGIITATEWDNFFALRDHKDAQPEIRELAKVVRKAITESKPSSRIYHLPYITEEERIARPIDDLLAMSAARCARVSYLRHDGIAPSYEDDLELYSQLVVRPYTDKRGNILADDDPTHMSPVEHQARQSDSANSRSGNFVGWIQNRKMLEPTNFS